MLKSKANGLAGGGVTGAAPKSNARAGVTTETGDADSSASFPTAVVSSSAAA